MNVLLLFYITAWLKIHERSVNKKKQAHFAQISKIKLWDRVEFESKCYLHYVIRENKTCTLTVVSYLISLYIKRV